MLLKQFIFIWVQLSQWSISYRILHFLQPEKLMNCDRKIKYPADCYALEIVQVHTWYNHPKILRSRLNLKGVDFKRQSTLSASQAWLNNAVFYKFNMNYYPVDYYLLFLQPSQKIFLRFWFYTYFSEQVSKQDLSTNPFLILDKSEIKLYKNSLQTQVCQYTVP